MEAVVEELHKPARRNFLRRKFVIRDLDETWQADLVDLSSYASVNKGYKFLLTIIDNFSKYAWAVPIKSKNGKDVSAAMESVLKQGRKPKLLHVDRGKEFYNATFESLMKQYDVKMYSTYSKMKASICERFNRTLKERMWKKFSLRGSFKWIDIISELVLSYNNTIHRTIKMKPSQVTSKNSKELFENIYDEKSVRRKKSKFKIGDKVRISKYKHVFEKGYTPNWTTEIFTVERVNYTNPVTYLLKDYENNKIEGGFYEQEMLKVKNADIYLIEKVLKRRGDELFVKWLGFDNSHNSWVNKKEYDI